MNDSGLPSTASSARQRGFSLVEVLVALVVCSIGLLGLAKMSSLAMVSTSVASSRSLAAIQASSLASAMHANRGYWGAGLANAITTVDATPANNFNAAVSCTIPGAAPCSTTNMAMYDLKMWALAVGALLPGYSATITCNSGTPPVNCTIQISWVENIVAADSSQTGITNGSYNANLQLGPTYTLYVEP